jgi:hypothetical protein
MRAKAVSHDLIVFAVVIVGRRDAAQADIGCSLKVGVLYARGDSDLLGIWIINDVDFAHGRNAEIAQVVGAGIDELVRLRASRRGNDVATANRDNLLSKPILTLAGAEPRGADDPGRDSTPDAVPDNTAEKNPPR